MRRLIDPILGVMLVAFGFFYETQPAARAPTDLEVEIRQGAAPQLRARLDRLDRYLTDGQPQQTVVAAETILVELRERWLSDDQELDQTVVEEMARTAVHSRNEALHQLQPGPSGDRGAFIWSLADGAVFADWKLGVPASVTIAQAILESDWGRSSPGNALFGLKGTGPAGSNMRRVVEYRNGHRFTRVDPFRAYHSYAESLEDHASLLANSRHYAKAREVSEDPDAFARALQGTYASDPRYAQKLSRFMDDYLLRRYNWSSEDPLR